MRNFLICACAGIALVPFQFAPNGYRAGGGETQKGFSLNGSPQPVGTPQAHVSFALQAPPKGKNGETRHSTNGSAQPDLKQTLESKVRAEWSAFKNKDKRAYSEFLADDFVAVEADNQGERNKWHVLREVESSVVYDYMLAVFRVVPLGPDAAFITYEASLQFPPKAQVRFERIYIGEVWVKRGGQWKALHYQETRVR